MKAPAPPPGAGTFTDAASWYTVYIRLLTILSKFGGKEGFFEIFFIFIFIIVLRH